MRDESGVKKVPDASTVLTGVAVVFGSPTPGQGTRTSPGFSQEDDPDSPRTEKQSPAQMWILVRPH